MGKRLSGNHQGLPKTLGAWLYKTVLADLVSRDNTDILIRVVMSSTNRQNSTTWRSFCNI